MKKKSDSCILPYKVSEKAVNLIAEISAAVEKFSAEVYGVKGIRLRKANRIKTIRGSTAIEGNTLTEEHVTAILEGKQVIAPQKEIDEILCAAAAYEAIESINPFEVKDLLKVHKLMMGGACQNRRSVPHGTGRHHRRCRKCHPHGPARLASAKAHKGSVQVAE